MTLLKNIVATSAQAPVILIRLAVGGVFLSEGIQKFLYPGENGVGRFMKIGIPAPEVMAARLDLSADRRRCAMVSRREDCRPAGSDLVRRTQSHAAQYRTEWDRDNLERRANHYATDLLLPEFIFAPRAKNLEITFETVRRLAAIFQTSLTATAIRLVELGSFPAVIVCHTSQQRRWFVRGPDIPDAIRLREKLGAYTAAYDLLRGATTNEGLTDVQADGWIAHPDSRRYLLREDSIRIGDHYAISLL